MSRKSASDIASKAIALIDQMEEAAKAEIRHYLSARLLHMTTPRGEANLVDCHPDADFEPSDEFLAGFKFAAELVGDENFDY